ncbi:hypothetical protein [Candidatus Marithrix sp. Canyon 246]|uniref:hypothetical protein n=1 Tax=Candidatus Marithrix sp. Canyon 246 TaxID=1827136 RepID=UPI00084A250F|nr:hypothetical protein [Candidatus Marithrix sp. Canyon 246]
MKKYLFSILVLLLTDVTQRRQLMKGNGALAPFITGELQLPLPKKAQQRQHYGLQIKLLNCRGKPLWLPFLCKYLLLF